MDHSWTRVAEIFHAALAETPEQRGAFLDAACGGNAALRAEVESLLASHHRAGAFLEEPAAIAGGLAERDEADAGVEPGRRIGSYLIEREIGRGGMGVVYEAEDTRLGRRVALKVISPAFGRDPARRERLRREARAAAALSHPAIATVFALEELDGRDCLVTEYVRGDTLRDELARGPLSPGLVLETGIRVARGLAAAHAAGVIHRDLKPDNVMRDRQGAVKILDFGIAQLEQERLAGGARLTGTGALLGTPGYMSPEQLDGSDVDHRSDIFALGVLLFEMATGTHPFAAATPAAAAARVMTADAPPMAALKPGLPPGLDDIVHRCLARHRADRYASADEVARDLEALRTRPVAAAVRRPVGLASPLWWWRLHQVAAMAVAAALAYGVWRVHVRISQDWTLSLFLAYIVSAAINGTLRAHLLFTSVVNVGDMTGQFRRAAPLVRVTDLALAATLLLSAAAVVRVAVLVPSLLAVFGVGWAVVSLIVEPATRKAAFQ